MRRGDGDGNKTFESWRQLVQATALLPSFVAQAAAVPADPLYSYHNPWRCVSFLHIFFVANDSPLPLVTHDRLRLLSVHHRFKRSDICHTDSKTSNVFTNTTHDAPPPDMEHVLQVSSTPGRSTQERVQECI